MGREILLDLSQPDYYSSQFKTASRGPYDRRNGFINKSLAMERQPTMQENLMVGLFVSRFAKNMRARMKTIHEATDLVTDCDSCISEMSEDDPSNNFHVWLTRGRPTKGGECIMRRQDSPVRQAMLLESRLSADLSPELICTNDVTIN